jgi:hypothetical protein
VAFYDAVLDRIRSAPGVAAAGLTSVLPHVTSMHTSMTSRPGDSSPSVLAGYRMVDAGYFDAAGIPTFGGAERALRDGAMIDRRLQQQIWDGASPVGGEVRNGFSPSPLTVSGVVGSVREWNQGDDNLGAIYVDYRRRCISSCACVPAVET